MTEEILNLMKTRKEMKKPEDEDQSEGYKEVDLQIKRECRKAKDKWFNDECDEIMKLESEHNIREMHNKVKSLTNKKKGANVLGWPSS